MTKQEFVRRLQRHKAWLPGKVVKLDFGDRGVVTVDGVAGHVGEEDSPAETVVRINWDDWLALSDGRLDAMRAYMSGRLRVEGDTSDAIALGGLFKELQG